MGIKIASILAMLCCYQCAICQNTQQRDSIMYMEAYKYIINDSINKNWLIAVSDSISDLDAYWDDELKSFPEERKKLKRYREKQWENYPAIFLSNYSSLLASLFRNQDVKRANTILFFSEFVDLMLMANINFYSKKTIGEYDKFRSSAYIWGTSYEYLFLFNKDGTIKKVFRHELILN